MAKKARIEQIYTKLDDGRTLSLFINKQTGLVVIDAVEKDGIGGNEFVRTHVPPPFTPEQKKQCKQVAEREG